ncbi:MAG: uridine diphosphate-N-acetylglucosamine-binding protein YvcK [Dehalococcoidia bacterium]
MRRLLREADFLKWLYPGIHIKRWLALLVIAVGVMTLGLSYVLREAYISGFTFPAPFYYITLQFIPRYVRGAAFIGGSLALVVFALWRLNATILAAVVPQRGDESLVNLLYHQRSLRRGPRVVAIGGGTGLSTLLRGLKEHTSNLTAIVTVADDGGSSGRLRRELGVLPPGDLRNCIAAMADAEPLMTRLFQYRFNEGSGLAGHSFGNLFIVAMSGVTGSFEEAIRHTSRVLAVRGQILPSTLANVTLYARTEDERTISGESNISAARSRLREVYLQPAAVQAYPEAIRAILDADLVVVGPGSLFTSVLPNLLVEGVRRALLVSNAAKVYVCNVATQPGETDSFTVGDHLAALERHVAKGLFQFVLANSNPRPVHLASNRPSAPVSVGGPLDGARLILTDVVSDENPYHHDAKKLAAAVMRIYLERDQLDQSAAVSFRQETASAL